MSQIPSAKLKKSNHPLSQSETQNQKLMVTMWTFGPVSGSKSSVIFKEGVDE